MNNSSKEQRITVFAPAKINLFLHILGKHHDGYHTIDSLVCFANIGDSVSIEPHPTFHFEINGPFSRNLENSTHLNSKNLVVKAFKALSEITKRPAKIKITLTKNLPIASGLGGGSADAAATLYGLRELWGLPPNAPYMGPLLKKLGADVPVCMESEPAWMNGIGEIISSTPPLPEIPIILVNPLKQCPTSEVFLNYAGASKKLINKPLFFETQDAFLKFLHAQDNDLTEPASILVPEIKNILNAIKLQNNCRLTRMSGSGATCFGLFHTYQDAMNAEKNIRAEYPDWWIEKGWINRSERV